MAGIYTPLYLGTIYIYGEKLLSLSIIPSLTIIGVSTVTGKSSRNRIVLAVITVLYAINVIGGVSNWVGINHLTITGLPVEDLSVVLIDVTEVLPLILADGLLVSSQIPMAQL